MLREMVAVRCLAASVAVSIITQGSLFQVVFLATRIAFLDEPKQNEFKLDVNVHILF